MPRLAWSHLACRYRSPAILTCAPQDIITGDEILSDTYDIKEIDGVAYEADCRKITVGNDNIGACPVRSVASLPACPFASSSF